MQAVLERLRSASIDWPSGNKGGDGGGSTTGTSRRRNNTPPSTQPRKAAGAPSTQQPPPADAEPGRKALPLLLTPPSLFQPGHGSGILNEGDLEEIDAYLPSIYQGYAWGLLYSLQEHGASNATFFRRVKGKTPTVLVVRTMENEIFGGFTTTPWAINVNAHGPEYYGTGESFLWRRLNEGRDSNDRIQQEEDGREPPQPQLPQQQQRRRRASTAAARAMLGGVDVFPWSRENNLNMLSTERSLAMGGGGGEYGLYLGENFESGVSGACETFGNPPLAAKGKHFEVLDLECWTLEEPVISFAREQQLSERRASMHQRSLSLDPRYGTGHTLDSPYKSVYESFDDDRRTPRGAAAAMVGNGGTWPRHVGRSQSMNAAALNFGSTDWTD